MLLRMFNVSSSIMKTSILVERRATQDPKSSAPIPLFSEWARKIGGS
jgi:hypothetical protein